MNKTILKIKQFFESKKVILSLILFLALFLSIWGIKEALAYYNETANFTFLGTIIGDFATGDGDINVMTYVENDTGRYNLTKSIPSVGYSLNADKTDCAVEYEIDDNNKITFSTTEKTTCKFYFDKVMDPDIKTLIMLETDNVNSTHIYEGNRYKLTSDIPTYGYEYLTYNCTNNSAITHFSYDEANRRFSIKTLEQNLCYLYFKKLLEVNVYIEQEGSDTYLAVDTIPGNKEYAISTSKASYCENDSGDAMSASITYENNELYIDAVDVGVCYVFLDLK